MSFRTTYVLFGVLLAELLIFGLFQALSVRPGEELYALQALRKARTQDKDFEKEITTVEIDRTRPTAEKLVFTRGADGHWKLTQPYEARIDADDSVANIISQVAEAHKDDRVDDPGRNLSSRGLEPPAVSVTLTSKDGKSWKLNLGNETFGEASRAYVFVNSSELAGDILAVRRGDLDSIYKTAKDYRLKDLVTPSSMNLQSVELTDATKKLSLKKEKEGFDRWKFVTPDYGEAEYETDPTLPPPVGGQPRVSSVKELLNDLESIKVAYNTADKDKVDDFVAENVKDLAQYGLDKPALRIGFERRVGSLTGGDDKEPPVKDTLLIGKDVADKDTKEPKVYARLESENNVVKVAKKNVEPLLKLVENPSSLRNKDLVKLKDDDKKKIDAIDITNAGGTMKLRKVDNQWRIYDGTKFVVADRAAVDGLVNALTLSRQVKDFPTKDAKDLGLVPPSGDISVWVEGIPKEEPKKEEAKKEEKKEESKKEEAKKDDKKEEAKKEEKKEEPKKETPPPSVKGAPTFKLVFGRKMPDNTVNVIREEGGQTLKVTLSDALLSRLNESRLAYLDKTLPAFAVNADIPKIVIQKGNATTLVEKTKNADGKEAWMLKGQMPLPDRLADAAKIDAILKELRELTADSIISETKPPANQLTNQGLLPPEVKVTVTIKKSDKESEDFIYSFGKLSDNKEKRHARIDIVPLPANLDRDWVFTVRPEVIDKLTVDLSDPSVTDFSPSKVKAVTLSGWQKLLSGVPLTLELDQKGMGAEGWKLGPNNKVPIELDGAQVEVMLNQLKHLKADKFLDHNLKEPPAGLELKDKEANLVIKLTFADAKEKDAPLVLTIGKYLEMDNGYAAMVSTRPGDVFVLPKKDLPRKDIDGKEKDLVEAGVGYFKK